MTKETLAHPIRSYTRMDGRRLQTAKQLDFRPAADFHWVHRDQRELLTAGLQIGAIVRYSWLDEKQRFARPIGERSMRVHLVGEYTGEDTTVAVPTSKWHPQGKTQDLEAPVFDFKIWKDMRHKLPIGSVAVAYLTEGESAGIYGVDHAAVQEAMDIKPSLPDPGAHFSIVQTGGLYYALSPEAAAAAQR